MGRRFETFVHGAILALIIGWVLHIGKDIFVPIVFGILTVYVIVGLTRLLQRLPVVVQFLIGNFLDPYVMGNSLNLSPFAILVSLTVWSTLWGIPGAFLAVPITAIIAIILSGFAGTRAIAVLLSRSGQV